MPQSAQFSNGFERKNIITMYGVESPYGPPTIPRLTKATKVSYLVRSLANGCVYYLRRLNGKDYVCAVLSAVDAKGFKTRREAEAFAKRIEKENAEALCIGRPPYTRIEVKTERIEVCAETEESSASDVL